MRDMTSVVSDVGEPRTAAASDERTLRNRHLSPISPLSPAEQSTCRFHENDRVTRIPPPADLHAIALSHDLAMSFTLTMSGVVVGRSELEVRHVASSVALGAFRPGLGYELAQPVFELYSTAAGETDGLARYRTAREALRLTLADASGASVSIRELHIRPRTEGEVSESGLVLEVVTDDARIWTAAS